ncbi:MAG: trypsin-like peptidase domain-containing protein [Saprospiraceae bacterium]|nr:trypsin-like peptidase domain-containing protein [Saprospiraceae bacterium]
MKNSIQSVKLIGSSILGAMIGVFIYTTLVNPTELIYIKQSEKAQLAAEREFVLSERANAVFKSSAPTDFINAASSSVESVVFIESFVPANGSTYQVKRSVKSTGSGVIISNDGYIVTNNHVIENAEKIQVTLNNNKEYKAKVIGFDEQTDLALLKIESTQLDYVVFGNSDSLLIGEWVLAVGNPFRLQSTVTAGIVSAKARNINVLQKQGIESFIQTDAAVNPGNSGGALINTNGELVGINTAILSSTGGYEGFSFAIPSKLVKKVVRDIKEYGVVQRGWMGVTIYNVDAPLAEELGLADVKGVMIDALTRGGAAKAGGLQKGDVLLSINDIQTNTTPRFTEIIGQFRPGDILKVKFFRNGKEQFTNVQLRNQLNTTDYVAVRKDKLLIDIGFELREMDSAEISRNDEKGVYVVSVYKNSKAGSANIEPGYIITSINDQEVRTVNELIKIMENYIGPVVFNGYYENYPGEFPYTFNLN